MSAPERTEARSVARRDAFGAVGIYALLLVASMAVAALLVFGLEAVESVIPRIDEFAMFVVVASILFYAITYRRLEAKARQAAAARQAEERLEALFEHAGEIVTVYDASGEVIYRSPSFERLLGHDPDEYPGLALALVHPEDRPRTEEALDRIGGTSTGETVGPIPFRVRTAEGEWRRFEGIITNLEDHQVVRGFVLNWRDVTARAEAEESARESYLRLRELNRRLQSIREEERIRLAREIHDELGQTMTGLRMELQRLAARLTEDPEREMAQRALDLARDVLAQVRRISRELRPATLDTLGLAAAVEDLAEEFRRRSGVECRLTLRDEGLDAIEHEVATATYRILQEALTNVARHAEAGTVGIRLAREDGDIALAVSDDGVGFDPDGEREGLGILGMRERAEASGGRLTIESSRGEGTEVRLWIPVAGRIGR